MKRMLMCVGLFLAGCSATEQHVYDQCLRAKLFQECLAAVPTGPTHVAAVASGWAGVVDECATAAQYHSIRRESIVKPECRP